MRTTKSSCMKYVTVLFSIVLKLRSVEVVSDCFWKFWFICGKKNKFEVSVHKINKNLYFRMQYPFNKFQ